MSDVARVPMELFTGAGNYAVVRLPGRKFPGVVFQGDSLAGLLATVREICELAQRCGNDDLRGAAEYLRATLEPVQARYEDVLAEHGIALPYAKPRRSP